MRRMQQYDSHLTTSKLSNPKQAAREHDLIVSACELSFPIFTGLGRPAGGIHYRADK